MQNILQKDIKSNKCDKKYSKKELLKIIHNNELFTIKELSQYINMSYFCTFLLLKIHNINIKKERDKYIIKLYKKYKSVYKILDKTFYSKKTIYRILNKYGIKTNKKEPITKVSKEELFISLKKNNFKLVKTSKELGMSVGSIKKLIKIYNLEKIVKKNGYKYSCFDELFEIYKTFNYNLNAKQLRYYSNCGKSSVYRFLKKVKRSINEN